MSSTLIERIKEAISTHVPISGNTQWYIDEHGIDCDAEEFWAALEEVLRIEKDQAIKDAVAWTGRLPTEPSTFGPCQLYPGRDCPGCENICARMDQVIKTYGE